MSTPLNIFVIPYSGSILTDIIDQVLDNLTHFLCLIKVVYLYSNQKVFTSPYSSIDIWFIGGILESQTVQ